MATKKKYGANGSRAEEWSKTGTCLNKPENGWIHAANQLERPSGISYIVRYVGCMEVIVSMKTLDFDSRTAVARESICRVAEAAGLKSTNRKKKDKKVAKHLSEPPNLTHAGHDVTLTITTDNISMVSLDTKRTILHHSMEEISFASGGDTETAEFVAYVAKDSANQRACHVLECDGDSATRVINTIAQAFELRYKQMLKRKKQPVVVPDRQVEVGDESAWGDDEPTYYNEGVEIDKIRQQERDSQPPPIPPLPDHYSARPSNLPLSANDFQPGDTHPASPLYQNTSEKQPENAYSLAAELPDLNSPKNEPWFHGKLTRHAAERMLTCDGEFLVRESSNKAGQYVLSGMKGGLVVHLLLVDPEGVVRTKDRAFDNVSHLISYHKDNLVPILSQEIELYLSSPVLR
ncbi:SHC-transforming protein 1-like [Watersipora subatra]|uniref:SHC-transforming protein 1-like n=1 Tax=Watersipora subatra TaxID=2589382 RepID=UPI00355C3729